MSDFLPIGLGRDGFDNVSHFKEITTSDSIPEQYLQISNTVAKWNASALQDIPVCTTDPTTGQVLVYNGSEWCPSTLAAGGGGGGSGGVSGTGTAGRIPSWTSVDTIDDWEPTIPDGNILRWDSTTFLPEDSGLKNTDAGWNASGINGVSACPDVPTNGQVWVYSSSIGAWCPSTLVDNTGVTGTGVTDRIVKWTNTTSVGDAGFGVTLPLSDGKILEFDLATTALIDSGYGRSDAGWNANKIQGVSACPDVPTNGQIFVYNSSIGAWCPSTLVNNTGTIDGNGIAGRLAIWTGLSTLSGWNPSITDGHILEWDTTTSAPVSTGYTRTQSAWNASAIDNYPVDLPAIVPNADSILIYDKATGTITTDPKIKFTATTTQFTFNQALATSSNLNVSGNINTTGSVIAGNIYETATVSGIPRAKSSGKIDYTWLEEASIDDFAKAGTTNYTAWYAAGLMTGVTLATFTMTANRLYAMPLVSPRRGSTIDDIEIYVTTGAASTSAIMGLYTNGGESDLYPNTLVASASAELDTTTTAQKRTWNIAYTLNPGQLYWLAVVSNGAPVIRGLSTNQAHYILGTASSANTTWTTHLYATHTYNSSLPSTFPTAGATAGTGAAPGLFYDFSA